MRRFISDLSSRSLSYTVIDITTGLGEIWVHYSQSTASPEVHWGGQMKVEQRAR